MLFLRFYALPGAIIPESRFAAYWSPAMRVIECVYFTCVSAHLHYKGFLLDGLPSPPLAFPMLFLCFSLGFSHFPVERYLCRGLPLIAPRRCAETECVYFTGVSSHLHYKTGSYLMACLAPRLLFLCVSYAFLKVLLTARWKDPVAAVPVPQ
jgi:hypothetical protein